MKGVIKLPYKFNKNYHINFIAFNSLFHYRPHPPRVVGCVIETRNFMSIRYSWAVMPQTQEVPKCLNTQCQTCVACPFCCAHYDQQNKRYSGEILLSTLAGGLPRIEFRENAIFCGCCLKRTLVIKEQLDLGSLRDFKFTEYQEMQAVAVWQLFNKLVEEKASK